MAKTYKQTSLSLFLTMLGYTFTIIVHVSNLVYLELMKEYEPSSISDDPSIKMFRSLLYRYFTCWTVAAQILYSAFGFVCDALLFYHRYDRSYHLPYGIGEARETMFSGVVWPCSLVVSTVFWFLYNVNRNLIYPEFLDEIIGPTSNHILHTLIVPIVLWEAIFRKRAKPHTHIRYVKQMIAHIAVYGVVFYYTAFVDGVWLYHIFEVTYGKLDFISVHLALLILFLVYYYAQWHINDYIHGDNIINKRKKII